MAVLPLESTSSLPTFTLPAYSLATTSIVGAICRQGPHHSAQKSTKTGTSDRNTSWSNVESVKLSVFKPAISSPKLHLIRIPTGQKDSGSPDKLLIKRRISGGGCVPGKILLHALPHHLAPGIHIGERLDASTDGPIKGLTGILRELEPRYLIDSIIQTPRGANYGNGSILQTIDLIQTAGLVAAGHQEHVGACFDAVSQPVVEAYPNSDTTRIFRGQRAERVLKYG